MLKKYTRDEIIKKFINVHGDKYDYSLVEYINYDTKVKIICKLHGVFEQSPHKHLFKRGCPFCNGGIKYNLNDFINKAKNIHGNKYDYSKVEYVNCYKKVKIICKLHGDFEQSPKHHLSGHGCKKCSNEKFKYNQYNLDNFINNAKKVHRNKYNYSKVKYINSYTKVKVICKKHGIFEQTPLNHINNKHGCPSCIESKGERKIKHLLENNNIRYISQKRFKGCKNVYLLSFDFYLPEKNICIEYDGKQHYEPIEFFGGEEFYKITKFRDNIKNIYCIDNNIKLIRIKYNENVIDILKNNNII